MEHRAHTHMMNICSTCNLLHDACIWLEAMFHGLVEATHVSVSLSVNQMRLVLSQ